MENNIQVFQNQEFGELRTVVRYGEPWFVAKDVCDALEIENSRDAVARLDTDEKNTVVLTDGTPGNPNKAIVSESGLYSLVLGSRKPQAHAFKRWVTHDVIPSIRKHGAYMTPETIEKALLNPDTIIQLATKLKEEQAKSRALEVTATQQKQIIAEMEPKASYYDKVLASPDPMLISVIAKDYGKSAKWFNATLHTLGIQYKLDGTWLLYQKYAEQGYTKSYTHTYTDKLGMTHTTITTCWTQKGRLFLYDLLRKHNIIPVMERIDKKKSA